MKAQKENQCSKAKKLMGGMRVARSEAAIGAGRKAWREALFGGV